MTSKIKVNILADGGDNAIITSDGAGSFTPASGLATGVLANIPAFKVDMSSNQTLTSSAWTKMNLNNELYDTDSAYDTSNYRFTVPSGKAGKYQFHAQAFIDSMSVSLMNYAYIAFYVNAGRNTNLNHHNFTNSDIRSFSMACSMQVSLSVGDYVEVYVMVNVNSGTPQITASESGGKPAFFEGYKLIGA
jgi:hypothetical protein